MNKPGFVIAAVALLCGAPCLAAECLLPGVSPVASTLSAVAPEMLRPAVADPYCLSALDALALIRARAALPVAGAYVPLTKDDNTPWRFEMSQNGKQMTSVEFDAWMKAKGIHVATGKASTAAAAADVVAPAPVPPVETSR